MDLYPTPIDKAAALGFGLAMNHPFIDGNKRIAHAAMAVFLELNGFRIDCGVDEQERVMLALAAGALSPRTGGLARRTYRAGLSAPLVRALKP